jgi:hypothetical protein
MAEMPGAGDAREVALQQRDARALDRDIGAGAHGDADIGGGKRRASLTPSPAMATIRPSERSRLTIALFWSGRTSASTSAMPSAGRWPRR